MLFYVNAPTYRAILLENQVLPPYFIGGKVELLKDDGYFLMTCFNLDGGANITDYDVYRDYSMHGGLGFSEEKIKTILSAYFDIQEIRKMKESDDPNVFGKSFMWVILMKKRA